MKKITKFLIALGMMGQLSSCDYLDIVPDERAQESDTWKTDGAVRGYLYSCYGYLPANRTLGDSYWFAEELTAVPKELFTTFKYGYYSPISLGYTDKTWSPIWNGIHQCYMFQESLRQVNNEYVTDEMKRQYLAETNFLIAYYHFLSMRSYGPTMIIRSAIDLETPISGFPERSSIDEVVAFINEKLDEAMSEDGLPTTWSGKDYGRATRLAALALKSRVYLYAASPLYNGNPEMYANFRSPLDGRPLIAQEKSLAKWEISATQTKYAIDEAEKAKFRLYHDVDAGEPNDAKPGLPNKAQRRLRYTNIDNNNGGNPEVIWADTRDDDNYGIQRRCPPRLTLSGKFSGISMVDCPTLQTIEAFYTKNGLPINKDKTFIYKERYEYINAPENCDGNNYEDLVKYSGFTPSSDKVMRLCTDREPRFYAWTTYHNGYFEFNKYNNATISEDPAKRAIRIHLLKNDPHGRGNQTDQELCISGFGNKKGVFPSGEWNVTQYPFPVFRLAELYLNYAEALVELDRLPEAKEYLNKVRERAGILSVDEAWDKYSTNPGYQNTKEGMREIVRAERMNELYLEGHKFFDIRRWKIAEQHCGMPDRGLNTNATKVEDFTPTDLPLPRNFHKGQYLMPIPYKEINKCPHIVQNPYYN